MSERSKTISRLCSDLDSRTSYINAKLSVLVPSQIKALRFRSNMPRQSDLARAAHMHQSRISTIETPGASNVTLETLSRLAAAFRVGLLVKFVSFSEMLNWENEFSQDTFDVIPIDGDADFLREDEAAAVASHQSAFTPKKSVFEDIADQGQRHAGQNLAAFTANLGDTGQPPSSLMQANG
jgi:transcriptional regulator with XRE-family HTH domain